MIQYYLDLEKQVKIINELNLAYGQIQKIYSTSFYISFSIRVPGKTWNLILGRGSGQEGVWIYDQPPPSKVRRKDNFLEYLRKHISSCSFLNIELDKFDRILKFTYQKYGVAQSILFFWKARKLYFLHLYKESPESSLKLLLSWKGRAVNINHEPENLYEFFDEVGRRQNMQHDLEAKVIIPAEKLYEEEMKLAFSKGQSSPTNFLQRKIQNIEGDLKKTRQWQMMQNILDEEVSLDMYEIKVGDHKIKFEGELNPFERRNLLFEKIKKLKKGESILQQRLADAQEEQGRKKNEGHPNFLLPISKPEWGKSSKKEELHENVVKENEGFRIFKFDSYSIGVGLNASGNDQLRSKWASKEDIWLHLDNAKSSHAIIKLQAFNSLTPDILNLAASIVAYFSHFKDEWIPIIYTSVKNLKGVSGSPGMVIYKKEKHLKCHQVETSLWLRDKL